MSAKEWVIVGFGLRAATLLATELGCFLFVVPTLFNLHADAADAAAALVTILGLVGGTLGVARLSREAALLFQDKDHE